MPKYTVNYRWVVTLEGYDYVDVEAYSEEQAKQIAKESIVVDELDLYSSGVEYFDYEIGNIDEDELYVG